MQMEWCVRDAIGHSTMSEDDEIREIQRGRCDEEDVGFHDAGVTNNAEEIRERCKTETNFEMRREGCMAKIDGVDEDDEAEGAGGREESDEWEEFGNTKVLRKHDPRQPSQQEKEEHEITQLMQALHYGERTRRIVSQVDGRRAASSGSALGLHVHGRREGREDVGTPGCERERDESCAQYGGSKEDDG